MIDLVYRVLQTMLNKEGYDYVSPSEFNQLATMTQLEIFEAYFADENDKKIRKNKGYINKGYANIDFNIRQKLTKFSDIKNISKNGDNKYILPENLYIIEDEGITDFKTGNVVEEVERSVLNVLLKSSSKPTIMYPAYESYGDYLLVYPNDIKKIKIRYVRKPKNPNWSYSTVNGAILFNPSSSTFQDFELHESEFVNIVMKLLLYFGINLREEIIMKVAEEIKNDKIKQ